MYLFYFLNRLERRRLRGGLIVLFNTFMRGSRRADTNLCTLETSERTQENKVESGEV